MEIRLAFSFLLILLHDGIFPSSGFTTDGPTILRTCDNTVEKVDSSKLPSDVEKALLQQVECKHCSEILQRTNFSAMYFSNNGFVHTVMDAYNRHHNLVIKPDDVWAAIMTQFSFFVNRRERYFRGKFVNFEGKKTLTVLLPGSLRTMPYDKFVGLMGEKIDMHLTDRQVKNWILPNFTTTKENDRVSIGVIFMATMKKYFDYKVVAMCGIPQVTLEGTLEDWQEILNRVEKLKEYRLKRWYSFLKPVLQQFVAAKQGNVDLDFWQKIVSYQPLGSGSDILSGWITVFCAFDGEGRWLSIDQDRMHENFANGTVTNWPTLDTMKIPPGIVEVDVTIEDIDKTEYKSKMFAGHFGSQVKSGGETVQPALGWAIALRG